MNGEEDEKPKCGLLALLPKPKGAAMSSTTAKQKISTETKGTIKSEAAIRKQFMPLKPRQIPPKQFTKTGMATTSTNSRIAKTNESDSDDEEFEQKLGSAIVDQQQREEEDFPKEGSAKPSQFGTQNKNAQEEKPKIFVDRPLLGMDYGSSSDSDDEEGEDDNNADEDGANKIASLPVDFFGLSAPKRPKLDDQIDDSAQIDEPTIFIDEVEPGPARPPKAPLAAHPMGDDDIASSSIAGAGPIRSITNQEASRMIYEKELAPFGVSSVLAEDAVSGMIDVSVDAALGPNVRQNLIRNLNNKQMAQIALGPLPKLKKSEEDKLAKRKHQITHLAQVAVSREEKLQEKWAESKQNKKMSRQKYGF